MQAGVASGRSERTVTGFGFRIVRSRWVTIAAIAILGATTAWFRLPPVARDTFWAEDGRLFLEGALSHPLWLELVTPYAGYLQTMPRLIAAATVAVAPPALYAQFITGLSCLATGIVAAFVFVFTERMLPRVSVRLALASICLLAPSLPREVLGNAANLHSIMFWLLAWLLLGSAPTRSWSWLGGVAAFFAAATEIQGLYLFPLAIYRIRDRRSWPVIGGFLLGELCQLAATLVAPRGSSSGSRNSPASLVFGFLINGVATVWVPQKHVGQVVAAGGVGLCLLFLLPFVVLGYLVWRRGGRPLRPVVLTVFLGGPLVYAASVLDNPRTYYEYSALSMHQLQTLWLTRYGVVPQMLLLSILVIGIGLVRRPSLRRGLGILLGAAIAVVVVFQPAVARRSYGPEWAPQVQAAAARCADAPPGEPVVLKETLGWRVTVSCGEILNRP
jgi:hypothetical protein